MRGRPPKPVPIRELEGNPSKRPLPKVPQPSGAAPECPGWLTDEAKVVWDENAAELEQLGLLTSLDGPAFTALCHWFAVFEDVRISVETRGSPQVVVYATRA